jgi:hypothetical protein
MQALGGAAKVQLLGYGNEVAQMPEFHVAIHTLWIIIRTNKILDVWTGQS